MTSNGKSIKVKILGSEYPLRGESEDLTKRVAGYVDEMIQSIYARIPEQQPLTVAVLSALNITEDLFKERERSRTLSAHVTTELTEMNSLLTQCLQPEA